MNNNKSCDGNFQPIAKLVANKWNKIVDECAGKIGSLIELVKAKATKKPTKKKSSTAVKNRKKDPT